MPLDAIRIAIACAVLLCGALLVLAFADTALAQGNPFGGKAAPSQAPEASGLVGFILAKQAEFYRALSGAIRAAKADGSALWALLGISFAYGVFHAAGPGHGKAVISSYVVANEETWRRGVILSFASAFLQAAVAVALVSGLALVLGAGRKAMDDTTRVIEIISYSLIALLGARLLWVKARAFATAWKQQRHAAPLSAAVAHAPGHHDGPHHHHACSHAHDEGHVHGPGCGHAHGPAPSELAGPGGWRRGLSAILAVGLRPCTGAILVLVFAAAQGLYWAGIAATFVMGLGTAVTVAAIATLSVGARSVLARFAERRPGAGTLVLRLGELAAAALVLLFGIALLTGYIVSEKMFGA